MVFLLEASLTFLNPSCSVPHRPSPYPHHSTHSEVVAVQVRAAKDEALVHVEAVDHALQRFELEPFQARAQAHFRRVAFADPVVPALVHFVGEVAEARVAPRPLWVAARVHAFFAFAARPALRQSEPTFRQLSQQRPNPVESSPSPESLYEPEVSVDERRSEDQRRTFDQLDRVRRTPTADCSSAPE